MDYVQIPSFRGREKKGCDYIFYGRDMDQSLPHSRGALCIFPIGKTFFFKKRKKIMLQLRVAKRSVEMIAWT